MLVGWLLGLVFLTSPNVNMCLICNVARRVTFLVKCNVLSVSLFNSMLLSSVPTFLFIC